MGAAGSAAGAGSGAEATGAWGLGAVAGAGTAAGFDTAAAVLVALVFATGCVGVELQPAIRKQSTIDVAEIAWEVSLMGKREGFG